MKCLIRRFRGDSEAKESVDLDVGEVHNLLSDDRRRRVISILSEYQHGQAVDVCELADRLTDQGDDRKAALISLNQRHFPSFALIFSYDDVEKSVVVTREVEAIAEAEEAFEEVVN